jgi:hypothetical protein
MIKPKGREDLAVAEIQGLYGPFSFPEKLLQQIWLRGDFDSKRAITTDGRGVQVVSPGRWNLLGGPDFKDARVSIGGVAVRGDIEVHLRAADWIAHRHSSDPAYANVVLHVILFPTDERATAGVGGRGIPVLVLLPLLNHDLEEYAADEAIERLADHPLVQARRELIALSPEELTVQLLRFAEVRWRQKVYFAKLRIARLGWESACHHTALEILGYRFNRVPMLAVAAELPFADWVKAGEGMADAAHAKFADRWSKQGVRPASHPLSRLRQYMRWMAARPNWPERLVDFADGLPAVEWMEAMQAAVFRRKYSWGKVAGLLADSVLGGEVGGTRFNTLVCDGLLPLLAAQANREEGLSGFWYTWAAGDLPASYSKLLRELGMVDKREHPMCHGVAQGLIGWLLDADQRHEAHLQSTEGAGLDNASGQKVF